MEKVGEPVDLVGHDWGSLLVQRAVSLRPDLIRTWACGNGPVDREYVWHDMAQQWQTPGVGEALMEFMGGDAMIEGLVAGGVPAAAAPDVVSRIDERMKQCILTLYRSAVKVGEEWEAGVAKITRPGLVLWGREDPFVAPHFAERLAARVRGRLHFFDGCGHFWPHERAKETAEVLEAFWQAQG
jgi:pimeloyl-ACP methyl ester carboxylesterase